MFGDKPTQAVAPPTPITPPPNPPTFASSQVGQAGRSQTARAGGAGSTIATSGQGDLLPASVAKKTLLGQ